VLGVVGVSLEKGEFRGKKKSPERDIKMKKMVHSPDRVRVDPMRKNTSGLIFDRT
jgi:hypothetical protein